jgi:hypothetical protein
MSLHLETLVVCKQLVKGSVKHRLSSFGKKGALGHLGLEGRPSRKTRFRTGGQVGKQLGHTDPTRKNHAVLITASKVAMMVALLLLPALARGQADVYVNGTTGSDSNAGTQALPYKTLSAAVGQAVTNSQKGVASTVVVAPGTYRESLTVAGGSTSAPVTIEAATNGTAIVSGADVWTGWTAYSGNSSIFTHSWPYAWGLCPVGSGPFEQDIVRRREMIIVNGTVLTQVLSLNEVRAGSFYVGASTVYVWPPSGTDMGTATVEVPTRANLLEVSGTSGTTLKGMTFEYANSCWDNQAVLFTSTNDADVESNSFLWNNGGGLKFNDSTNVTSEDNVANHNGQIGLQGYHIKYWTSDSDEAAYNNWRGSQGVIYPWGAGGADLMLIHNGTFNGLKMLFNEGRGLHFDTDNANISVDSLVSYRNLMSGVQVELSEGPATISNSYICSNALANYYQQQYDGAVNVNAATYLTLTQNHFADNGAGVMAPDGGSAARYTTNWETGQELTLYTEHLTMTDNTIEGDGSQPVFSDGYIGGSDWTNFVDTLTSNDNTWWNSANQYAFTVPVPADWTGKNLPGWRSLTGKDADSVFEAPSTNPASGCDATPDMNNYWFVVNEPSLTVSRGGHGSITVSSVAVGSFSSDISLTSDGLQSASGASGKWSATSIGPSGSATFTITAGSATPEGTYPVVLIANSGSLTRTITVSLVVN